MDEYKRVTSLIEADVDQFFLTKDIPKTRPDIQVSPGDNFYVTPSIDGKRSGVYYLDLSGRIMILQLTLWLFMKLCQIIT